MDDDDNLDELEGFGTFGYQIDCPQCDHVFFEEGDVRGDLVNCPDCGVQFKVHGLG